MAQGIHRVTANSKRGRQLISPGKFWQAANQDKIIAEHNAKVDAAKKAKKAAKKWLTGGVLKIK